MRKITFAACSLLLLAVYLPAKGQTEAEMKKWTEYMTPSAPHKMMATWNGIWEGEVSMWMDPAGPPSKSKSKTTNKMELGGRYQVSNHEGTFGGMPFNGMSITAYDNNKKAFESIWIDNMGSGIMHLQGPWDEATKTINLKGKAMDPTTGKEMDVRETFKIIDSDTQQLEMFLVGPDGKEYKTMEIIYKRKK